MGSVRVGRQESKLMVQCPLLLQIQSFESSYSLSAEDESRNAQNTLNALCNVHLECILTPQTTTNLMQSAER